jgi:hypothetical protein
MTPIELSEESIPWEPLRRPRGSTPRDEDEIPPFEGGAGVSLRGMSFPCVAAALGDFPRLPFQLKRR